MRRFGDEESKVPYFEAGLKLLAEHGAPGLKLTAVCQELDVTTGGFYYYFKNLKHYVDELLDYWFDLSSTELVRTAEAEADPWTRLRILLSGAVSLPHQAESAIRHWASSDAGVASVLAKADYERTEVFRSTLAQLGLSEDMCRHLTVMAIYLLVGHESIAPGQRSDESFRWGLEMLLSVIEREAT